MHLLAGSRSRALSTITNMFCLKGMKMTSNEGWPEAFGFRIEGNVPCYIVAVSDKSLAQQAGLQPGDQIVELDGHDVTMMSREGIMALAKHCEQVPPSLGVISRIRHLELVPDLKGNYGVLFRGTGPVYVQGVAKSSPAVHVGLKPGDMLLEINGVSIRHMDAANRMIRNGRDVLRLAIIPGQGGKQGVSAPPAVMQSPREPGTRSDRSIRKHNKAVNFFTKVNVVLEEDPERKEELMQLLRDYATDKNVETFGTALAFLLTKPAHRKLLSDIRIFVPQRHRGRFDYLVSQDMLTLRREVIRELEQRGRDNKPSWDSSTVSSRGSSRGSSRPSILPSPQKERKLSWKTRTVVVEKGQASFGFVLRGHSPVYIESIEPGSASDRAGLKVGDHLLRLNGLDVSSATHKKVITLLQGSGSKPTLVVGVKKGQERKSSDDRKSISSASSLPARLSSGNRSPSVLSLSSVTSSLSSQQVTEIVRDGRTFKQQMEHLLTPSEKHQIKASLKRYKDTRNADRLIQEVYPVLDTPAKEKLWGYIIRLLPTEEQHVFSSKVLTVKTSQIPVEEAADLLVNKSLDLPIERSEGDGTSMTITMIGLVRTATGTGNMMDLITIKTGVDKWIIGTRMDQTTIKAGVMTIMIGISNLIGQSIIRMGMTNMTPHMANKMDQSIMMIVAIKMTIGNTMEQTTMKAGVIRTKGTGSTMEWTSIRTGEMKMTTGTGGQGGSDYYEDRGDQDYYDDRQPRRTDYYEERGGQDHYGYRSEGQYGYDDDHYPGDIPPPPPGPAPQFTRQPQPLYPPEEMTAEAMMSRLALAGSDLNKADDQNQGITQGYQPSVTPGYQPSVTPGYQPSVTPGYQQGVTPGYHQGITPGYQPGVTPGYQQGVIPEHQQGITPGYQQDARPAYQQGITPGYQEGITPEYQQGILPGYQQGITPGYQQGITPGYQQGVTPGYQGEVPVQQNIPDPGVAHGPPLHRPTESVSSSDVQYDTTLGESTSSIPLPPPPPPSPLDLNASTSSIPMPPPLPPGKAPGPRMNMNVKRMNWEKLEGEKVKNTIWGQIGGDEYLQEVVKVMELEHRFSMKTKAPVAQKKKKVVTILPHKKAYNIAIVLGHLKMSHAEIRQAVLQMDDSRVSPSHLKQLLVYAAEDEEMNKIPGYKTRLKAMIFKANFAEKTEELRQHIDAISRASWELKNSQKLAKILQLVLAMGNYLNEGNIRVAKASGFRVSFLRELDTTKTSDKKSTFLHILANAVSTNFSQYLAFSKELPTVPLAAKVSNWLVEQDLLELESVLVAFMDKAADEIQTLRAQYSESMKEFVAVAEYYGEDPKLINSELLFTIFADFMRKFDKAHYENITPIKKKGAS
uniref:Delphilin n=1 Tax=Branchiostoma floridae TaxID=7739 RepID=C3Y8Y6_BRAFL|eukprot:XP_002607032.1 hypothetical protein BRAFLDRAFT_93583 [Branchiostoma floridae]